MQREKEFLQQVVPCDTDIYDDSIKMVDDAVSNGKNYCLRRDQCLCEENNGKKVACTMRFGVDVAKYVSGGSNLDDELGELKSSGLLDNRIFINSGDRKTFLEISEPEEILSEIKRVAEYLLK